jgi:hypothetical protein
MGTVRCKTWDSFTVTSNRHQHRAALRLTGSMTVPIVLAQTIKRFALEKGNLLYISEN